MSRIENNFNQDQYLDQFIILSDLNWILKFGFGLHGLVKKIDFEISIFKLIEKYGRILMYTFESTKYF